MQGVRDVVAILAICTRVVIWLINVLLVSNLPVTLLHNSVTYILFLMYFTLSFFNFELYVIQFLVTKKVILNNQRSWISRNKIKS